MTEDEIVTSISLYNFVVPNSPVIRHLGEMIISNNWWNQFWWNLWCWNRDNRGYLCVNFHTQRSGYFRDTIDSISEMSAKEIGKLGLPVSGASLHFFQKMSTLDSSIWRNISVYPIRSKIFQVLKLGFLWQTLDQPAPELGWTPQIGKI